MPIASPIEPKSTALIGLQWGDEGKGKTVDLLASEHDAVVRYNGGANAGHSVVVGNERYKLHLIPSGILYPGKLAVVGNGVVLDPETFVQEIDGLRARGVDTSGLVLSSRAHIVLPYHKTEDELREESLRGGEGTQEIGTTRRGIGPCYAEKVQRSAAVRVEDLVRPDALRAKVALAAGMKGPMFRAAGKAEIDVDQTVARTLELGAKLAPMIQDTTYLLNGLIAEGKRVLFEGANGTLLDVDHGTYPFVTSSNTGVAGISSGTGVPPRAVKRVVGVMKAYSTRVGSGPMPTELMDQTGHRIRERGREYGTTTGRPRRVGWLDLVAVKYTVMINGVTGVCLTLLDVLAGFDEILVCTHYEVDGVRTDRFPADASELSRAKPVYTRMGGFAEEIGGVRRRSELPAAAERYVSFIEEQLGVPAEIVSVGPGREQTLIA
jgi:adenylosuccinate synthase